MGFNLGFKGLNHQQHSFRLQISFSNYKKRKISEYVLINCKNFIDQNTKSKLRK